MSDGITERRVTNPKGNPANMTRAGMGREKGVPNKINRDIKEMILTALSELGGYKYLVEQGKKNPTAFMGLVGKVLPMQIAGHDGGPLVITFDMGGSAAISGPSAPMIDGVVEQIEC
jgi:hypothetical protein